jgi:hypothetical protein
MLYDNSAKITEKNSSLGTAKISEKVSKENVELRFEIHKRKT